MTTGAQAAPRHFCDLVRCHAKLRPGSPAVKDPIRSLTYERLAQATDAVAVELKTLGLQPGDRLLIVAENTVASLVLLLAAQSLNAWPAMVNARMPTTELDALRKLVEPKLIAFASEGSPDAGAHADAVGGAAPRAFDFGPIRFSSVDRSSAPESVGPDAASTCGMVIFTSGTTGLPKAVMLSQAALVGMAQNLAKARGVSQNDIASGAGPLSHIMGLSVLASTLWAGACLELLPRLDLPAMVERLRTGQMMQMSVVPTVYARLLEHISTHGIDLSGHRLKYASSGGAVLDPGLKARFEAAFGIPLVNAYGMSECAPLARAKNKFGNPPACVGPPEAGVEVCIMKEEGQAVAQGAVGELWARSPSSMMGYYRNEEATKAAMRPGGFIATGDLARILPGGEIEIVGRAKDLIIRSGFNVYPAEVEAAINSHPSVLQSAVVGRLADDGNEEVLAFVQFRRGQHLEADELVAHVRARLAPYKIPAQVFIRDTLPLGATGKILKRALIKDLEGES